MLVVVFANQPEQDVTEKLLCWGQVDPNADTGLNNNYFINKQTVSAPHGEENHNKNYV